LVSLEWARGDANRLPDNETQPMRRTNMRRWTTTLAAAAVIVLGMAAAAAVARDPAGLQGPYQVSGTTPAGGKYLGTAEIKHVAGQKYQITWRIDGNVTVGEGTLTGVVMNVTFTGDTGRGRAEYVIKPNGNLVGSWWYSGGVREGQETLRPR
jgi:hypothetical protein